MIAFGADTYVDTYGAGVTAYAGARNNEPNQKIVANRVIST